MTAENPSYDKPGYGRICRRGHRVEAENAYRTRSGYWDCRECRAISNKHGGGFPVPREHAPNPWYGNVTCPHCRTDDWTLPVDGHVTEGRWRCVACHLSLNVKRRRDQLVVL